MLSILTQQQTLGTWFWDAWHQSSWVLLGYFSWSDTCFLSGMWLDVDVRTDTKKASSVQKRLDYELKINHSRLIGHQHNWWGWRGWRGLYDHMISTRIFTFTLNEIFMWAPKIMRQMATATIWIWQSSRTNCVFHIIQVGADRRVSI